MGGGDESCPTDLTRSARVHGGIATDAVWKVCNSTCLRIRSDGFSIRMDRCDRTRATWVGLCVFHRCARSALERSGVNEKGEKLNMVGRF